MDLAKGIDSLATKVNLQEFVDTIEYRVARNRHELEKAYQLVYEEYLKRNYVAPNPAGMKLSIYNSLPQNTTFVAVSGDEVLATASMIIDSPLGLPMDNIYSKELEMLYRSNNKKICEISMLASKSDLFKDGVSMMLNAKKLFFIFFLFKAIFDYVRFMLKLDYMCITLNPKHSLTYDFLLFKDFGRQKTYDNVGGAPAIAKSLNIKDAEEECKRLNRMGLYKMFFLKKTAQELLTNKAALSEDDLRYFFIEKSDIFKKAATPQMNYIKECYPLFDFGRILA